MPLAWSLGIAAVALLARCGAYAAHGRPRMFGKYVDAAYLLNRGELPPERVLDFSPLYLEMHRLLDFVGASAAAASWIQCGVGAVSCVVVAWITAGRLGRAWGLVAGLLLAVAWDAVVYDLVLEPEAWLVSFALLAMWFAQTGERAAWRPWVAGLALGCAIAMRPSAVTLAPAAIFLLLSLGPGRGRRVVAFGLAVAVCWVALGARNASYSDAASMSPWLVFYIGNNPMASGMWREDFVVRDIESERRGEGPDLGHQIYREIAVASGASPETPDDYWRDLALHHLRESPGSSARLFAEKVLALGQPVVGTDVTVAADVTAKTRSWPLVPTHWLFALGVSGFLLCRRTWPAALAFAGTAGVLVLLFVSTRYRVMLLPWLLVGAAGFGSVLSTRLRARREAGWRPLALPLATLSLFVGVTLLPLPPGAHARQHAEGAESIRRARRDASALKERLRAAAASERLAAALYPMPWQVGKLPIPGVPFPLARAAELHLARSLEAARSEDSPWAWLRHAMLLDFAGRSEAALDAYARVEARAGVADRPLRFRAAIQAGILAGSLGRVVRAREAFERADRVVPSAPEALAGLLLLGRDATTVPRVNPVADLLYYQGRMALQMRRPDRAVGPLQLLTERLPGWGRARLLYALALERSGRHEAALEVAGGRALPLDPMFSPVEIFEREAEARSQDRRVWRRLAAVATRVGEVDPARRAWKRVERLGALTPDEQARVGRLALTYGDLSEAVTRLRAALEGRPDDNRLIYDVSRAEIRLEERSSR